MFDKRTDEEDIKLQLAELSVKLADVRKQVGELNGELSRLLDKFHEAKTKSTEYESYAKKAVAAGNPADARVFLEEKHKWDKKLESYNEPIENVSATRKKAMELHDKMVRDINDAKTRLAVLTARKSTAEASIKYSKTVGSDDFEQKLSGMEVESDYEAAMREAEEYAKRDE